MHQHVYGAVAGAHPSSTLADPTCSILVILTCEGNAVDVDQFLCGPAMIWSRLFLRHVVLVGQRPRMV